CRMMEEQTFPDAAVQALLKKMICVRIDVDHDPATAQAFQVTGIPRLVLLPAGGGAAKLDTMGFRPPDEFAKELRQALNLPDVGVNGTREDSALVRVRQALSGGSYAALRAKQPKVAAAGLRLLVRELGVFREEDLPAAAGLLRKSGSDAFPALIDGL